MAEAVLEARDLRFTYPGADALNQRFDRIVTHYRHAAIDGLNLSIPCGQRLAVLGANGAGKSTLLLLFNGTLRPTQGKILIEGYEADYSRAGLRRWRQKVGLVFQDPDDQLFAATVYQDVSYGPMNLRLPEAEVRRRTEEALSLLGIIELADVPIRMLSGGQRKRAAIAGIMAMEPEILILDEPTAGLDALGEAQLLSFIDNLSARGTTVILSIHDTDLALAWADEVVVLAHGKVICQGAPKDVLNNSDVLTKAHLRLPRVIDGWRIAASLGNFSAADPPPATMQELIHNLWKCAKVPKVP